MARAFRPFLAGIGGRWRELPATSCGMSAGCGVVRVRTQRGTCAGCRRLVLQLFAADHASVAVQPSGTVTLVFTDIEGSTALLDELGAEAFKEALADHRRALREAFGAHAGYEVDEAGDGLFYAFASASQAVAAVAQAMASLADGPVRIRVGVHTGEPLLDPPKYVGVDLHKAARIMSAAHGGQVLLSGATRELVARMYSTWAGTG